MDRDFFEATKKTLNQLNGNAEIGKSIDKMTIDELKQLEVDLNDTEAFIKINNNGVVPELAANIIKSLRIQINNRKK